MLAQLAADDNPAVRLEVASAARQAVAAIQARLDRTERGQLSLAGGGAGALSLVTDTEPGKLSFAAPEED